MSIYLNIHDCKTIRVLSYHTDSQCIRLLFESDGPPLDVALFGLSIEKVTALMALFGDCRTQTVTGYGKDMKITTPNVSNEVPF